MVNGKPYIAYIRILWVVGLYLSKVGPALTPRSDRSNVQAQEATCAIGGHADFGKTHEQNIKRRKTWERLWKTNCDD